MKFFLDNNTRNSFPYFTFILIPYLIFNWIYLVSSPFFSFFQLFLIFGFIFSIDFISFFLIKNKFLHQKLLIIPLSFFIVFIYGFYAVVIIQNFFISIGIIDIRGRFIILFFSVFVFLSLYFFSKYFPLKIVFVYFFMFALINIIFLPFNSVIEDFDLKNGYKKIILSESSDKPVVFLVLDEYASPNEMYPLSYDSSVYDFSSTLMDSNWLVRNSSTTLELSTIYSLSSLFNFNLSKSGKYSKFNFFHIGSNFLINSSFYDSLNMKNIDLINLGIFDVGEEKPLTPLYLYPKNFLEHFLFNSIYFHVINNTNGLNWQGLDPSFFISDLQNNFIFDNLSDSLCKVDKNNVFVYAHLFMPHYPYKFKDEFYSSEKSVRSYYDFWNFTNRKLDVLLKELTRNDKYRIIISGDHGYRGDSSVNPRHTFMAFYGFSEKDLESIESVQDLGNLIIACY